MALNRRGFLGVLATVAAGATLDPERALWVRGARTISVPAPLVVESYLPIERYAGMTYSNGFSVSTKALTMDDLTAAMAIMRQQAYAARLAEETFILKLLRDPLPPYLIAPPEWRLGPTF